MEPLERDDSERAQNDALALAAETLVDRRLAEVPTNWKLAAEWLELEQMIEESWQPWQKDTLLHKTNPAFVSMEVIRKVVVIDVVIFDVSGFSGNALLGIIMNLTFIEGVCQC